jgi:hypothetical protein
MCFFFLIPFHMSFVTCMTAVSYDIMHYVKKPPPKHCRLTGKRGQSIILTTLSVTC